jgi:D-alanyl-D-alanine endopeptidase (penicillin-binding protein 7)
MRVRIAVVLWLACVLGLGPTMSLAATNHSRSHAKHKTARAGARTALHASNLAKVAALPHIQTVAGEAAIPGLKSNVALVIDQASGRAVVAKNIHDVQPIASITKLMTALVVLDAQQPLSKYIAITDEDVDTERGSRSRLKVGTELSRNDLLHLALMSSENRAAHALGRNAPGGLAAFVEAMNEKARALGMERTRFVDPTGLSSANVSTAADLAKLVEAAHGVSLIRQYSTDPGYEVKLLGREVRFHNTNRLVASSGWDIGLSKTGFINEAGRCLVMRARINGRPLTFVLLDSWGKMSRIGDANRIRKWLTTSVATVNGA